MSGSNSPLVKLDIFFKPFLNFEFISAKSFEFVLTQVRTRLLIYIFRPINYNGFRVINSASVLRISKERIGMTDMGSKGYGPYMTHNLDQKDDIRSVLLLLQLFKRRIRMVSIK